MAEATADPATAKARFAAGLAQLKKAPQVDPSQLAAIGYCFGGAVVLDMARSGESSRPWCRSMARSVQS